jgi:hypothetical protein
MLDSRHVERRSAIWDIVDQMERSLTPAQRRARDEREKLLALSRQGRAAQIAERALTEPSALQRHALDGIRMHARTDELLRRADERTHVKAGTTFEPVVRRRQDIHVRLEAPRACPECGLAIRTGLKADGTIFVDFPDHPRQ